MDRSRESLYRTLAAAAIVAATLLVYLNTLQNGFVYDDNKVLLANPWITDAGRVKDIMTSSVMSFGEGNPTSNTYRPVVYLLWMALYHAAGFSAKFFHLVNITLHAVNAVLVFAIAGVVFSGGEEGGFMRGPLKPYARLAAPVFAGLVFALHTVNTEVVNWVSAQAELSFTFFVLLGFYLYIRRAEQGRRGWGSLVLPAVFFFVGLLGKETAMAFIPMAAAYDLSAGGLRGVRKGARGYALFIIAAAAYMAIRMNAVGGVMHHKQIDLSAYETLINVFPLVFDYFAKLAYPAGLNALYEFHPAHSITDARVLLGAGATAVFVLAAVLFRKNRAVFSALAWIITPLLPVLYIPALSTAAFADRYMYLPSAGFALLLAAAVNRVFVRQAYAPGPAGARVYITLALSAALLLSYSVASVKRSAAWRSDYTLWADTVEKSPNNGNVHYNLAWASQARGDLRGAVIHYREAVRLDPGAADAHYNLGIIYANDMMLDEAATEFSEALRVNPGFEQAREWLDRVSSLKGLN